MRETTPVPRRELAALGVAAAVAWIVCHLLVHVPRGWPFDVGGEWDLLLPAIAIARGVPIEADIATIHGFELGAWMVEVLLSLLIRAGVAPLLAGKLVAVGVGALVAGFGAVLVAWTLGPTGSRRARVLGVATFVGVLGLSYPLWHHLTSGTNGTTNESLVPQLAVILLTIAIVEKPSARRVVALGVCGGLCWLLSPASLPTLGFSGLVAGTGILRAELPWMRRLLLLATALITALAVILLTTALTPGGAAVLERSLRVMVSGWLSPVPPSGVHAPHDPLTLLRRLPEALEGGSYSQELRFRPHRLAALSWALLISPIALAWMSRRGPRLRLWLLAAATVWAGASLMAVPWQYRTYPPAYRYWIVFLVLAAATLGCASGLLYQRARKADRRVLMASAMLPLALGLLGVPELPRTIDQNPWTRERALVMSGWHRLRSRPTRTRHEAFLALLPQVPADQDLFFATGYGLLLGEEAARDEEQGRTPDLALAPVLASLSVRATDRFLIGFGCGLTKAERLMPRAKHLLQEAPGDQSERLAYGVARCALAPRRNGTAADWLPQEPGHFEARDWSAVGEALRAGGWPTADLGRLGAPAEAEAALVAGHRRPANHDRETDMMNDLWNF